MLSRSARAWTKYRVSIRPVTSESASLPSRQSMLRKLQQTPEFDVVVVGGGSTGSGAALDAAMRGLSVACFEREDFGSGTSSRSTKLLWGGSRYLVQAMVNLFHYDLRLLRKPKETWAAFAAEFKMVLNCHRERTFLLSQQPHLTQWLPIAVPLTKWFLWPPPFNHPVAALGPLGLFTVFFKFYDMLSGFRCPPSHIMNKERAFRKFPQLSLNNLKYCSVFYEGQHDDARTNLCIAQTAALEGALMLNYCVVESMEKDVDTQRVHTVVVRNTIEGTTHRVRAKSVLVCGGPYTDSIRKLVVDPSSESIVEGAGGVHVVLPSYFAPAGIGMVDMSTSDGRFLFLLPWEGSVLVGTTDRKVSDIALHPAPTENEIRWLLKEASKYLNPELSVRRRDVLSAWCGIRPLVRPPPSSADSSTAAVSRDHTILTDENVVYILGGKWTTYREMAEDAINDIVRVGQLRPLYPCRTLQRHFIGFQGYSPNLAIRLTQNYGIPIPIAQGLVHRYGGRAADVLTIAQEQRRNESVPSSNKKLYRKLATGFNYIEEEVIYAVRYEWAQHAEDIIARRSRIAFLNKAEALQSIDRVVELMAKELQWSEEKQRAEKRACLDFLRTFGGPVPLHDRGECGRYTPATELKEVLQRLDTHELGGVRVQDISMIGEVLSYSLRDEEINHCKQTCDPLNKGLIPYDTFIAWWNSEDLNPHMENMQVDMQSLGSGTAFG